MSEITKKDISLMRQVLCILAVLEFSITMVCPPASAGNINQAKAQHAEQLFDQGIVAFRANEYSKAINSFEKGLEVIQEATVSTDLFSIPKEEAQPYLELYCGLIKNTIISYFQAGQALAKVGTGGVDAALLKKAANYFREAVNRITQLEAGRSDIKRILDESVRFDKPWPFPPSAHGGLLGFSDYYLGGCYVNLALIAEYLNDPIAEDQWVQKLTTLQQPELLAFFQRAVAEARARIGHPLL